jgi:AraC-like DNA-binding protein
VERALEKIRREACFGLTAADVIAEMKLPRRGAERRFRQATGSSILEEINRHRLERAFSLLRKPGYPIALIAQQCGWSNDVFLKRLFKRTTGMTMMQYLYEQRFLLARRQLTDSAQPISTIALNCGFGSSSHFCTMFRRREGIPPHEYRARAQKHK